MGAWIETLSVDVGLSQHWSHPSWVRGLKHLNLGQDQLDTSVAPFMGAWIETQRRENHVESRLSHPSWVRGLKRGEYTYGGPQGRRTLHGCVD